MDIPLKGGRLGEEAAAVATFPALDKAGLEAKTEGDVTDIIRTLDEEAAED